MAAVWINGFVNGQEATGFTQCLFTIAAICRPIKSTAGGGEGGEKLNTNTLITVNLEGVQSSDSERLEQPLLTSFVQAGNINSS